MPRRPPATDPVSDAYEDVALILGGYLACNPPPEPQAWKLAGEITHSWFRAVSALSATDEPARHAQLHPSLRASLAAIRSQGRAAREVTD